MRDFVRRLYLRIGIHKAPKGSWLYALHHGMRSTVRSLNVRGAKGPLQTDLAKFDFIVAFRISGGIGDHLVAARYIRDLMAVSGPFAFDVYSYRPEIVKWIFAGNKQFNACYDEFYFQEKTFRHYAASLWLMSFVYIHSEFTKLALLAKHNPKLVQIAQSIEAAQSKIEPMIEQHPMLDGYLGQIAVLQGANRSTYLQQMSGIAYGGDAMAVPTDAGALAKFGLTGKIYITVHNGFDPHFDLEGAHKIRTSGQASTKCYPHFSESLRILRQRFPDICIVQLGTKTSTPLTEVNLDLIGKTSLPESADILKHSMLHIDNESGLVHLAACFGVMSCVVFGPTSVAFFGYPANTNIAPNFCGNCWWMSKDWMVDCFRGFGEARCLSEQPPQAVADAVLARLEERMATGDGKARLHG